MADRRVLPVAWGSSISLETPFSLRTRWSSTVPSNLVNDISFNRMIASDMVYVLVTLTLALAV